MIYCIIQGPSPKIEQDLRKLWPINCIWFKPNYDIIVGVDEVFTDDLGPHKKLYLNLQQKSISYKYDIPYEEFTNYYRRRAL